MSDNETPSALTDRQVRFCQEYIVDLNATQAYIRAGYAEDSADANSHRFMGNEGIKAYIQELMDRRAERLRITADEVLVSIDKMRKATVKSLFDGEDRVLRVSEWDDDFASAVNGIKFTKQKSAGSTAENPIYDDVIDVKLVDKKGATELLGRHLKLFADKVEHSGSVTLAVTTPDMTLEEATRIYQDNLKAFDD
ncbi:terminase small subunit [uncultured Paraglaciecola sp.]|uniref:terminase small subunit n=1 Tax=uncultured Paraglaciecola sp. TaxID=1765024 RepID=UPI0026023126|nr:terminase small subunit [uncultured Paraglaciecola sp.]